MQTTVERPLRADARRNREAILSAAKAVFAKHGADAQMDDIARKAKLGVGTLYRHFPTKEALIVALVAERVDQIAAFAKAGLDETDAFLGLRRSMWRGAELAAKDRGVSQMLAERGEEFGRHAARELVPAAAELIRRAQAQGTLRADFTVQDMPVLMCGVAQSMQAMGRDPLSWQRHLQLIFDGMRARDDLEPLPPVS